MIEKVSEINNFCFKNCRFILLIEHIFNRSFFSFMIETLNKTWNEKKFEVKKNYKFFKTFFKVNHKE